MQKRHLTAREAAAELNVSRATLYAYVSRGLVRSETADNSRARLYRAEDVEALRARKTPARHGDGDAASPLDWGAPVLESGITLIADGGLFYRGRDALRLAETASLESVAALLWRTGEVDPFADAAPRIAEVAPDLAGIERCQALLPHAAAQDRKAYNLEPLGVARTGARILRLVTAGFGPGMQERLPIHRALAAAWGAEAAPAEALIRAALVLCADHELNASAFAVRVVASTRATPYGAVTAGLAALAGPLHGGQTAQVAAMLDEVAGAADPEAALAARLRRGEHLPGFGHPLYPAGDPRARLLLEMLARMLPDSAIVGTSYRLAEAARSLTERRPNVDFALVALVRALGLPAQAALALFAVGRTAGWIAHAQEQYGTRQLIRPRARYTGELPQPAKPGG